MSGRYPDGAAATLLAEAAGRLAEAGIETARLDARVLLALALEKDPSWLVGHPEALLEPAERDRFQALVERRAGREPVAYITGVKEFWSLPFRVTRDTLIPRPDSEALVAAGLDALDGAGPAPRILDLGTGSGCLLLALLSERPAASGLGIDINPGAVAVAADNACRLGLAGRARFVAGDWLDGLDGEAQGPFQLVVANPPYISEPEMAGLESDVRDYEPHGALRAGPDGLDAYRVLSAGLAAVLAPDGLFIGEFGLGQADAVAALLESQGFHIRGFPRDAAGRRRCLVAGRSA